MSKRSTQSIRFGITDGSGKSAATWNCLTPTGVGKSDIYLICRSLKGALHASLHESGLWHIAYSTEFFAENLDAIGDRHQGRFIDKWPRPKEIAPGVTLTFRIITPHSAVNTPIASSNENIVWIPAPPPGQAVEIDILITSPHASLPSWPGKYSMNTKLVGSISLESGDKIWVVYMVIACPNFKNVQGTARYFKGRSKDDLKGEGLRIIAFAQEKDGSRVILDSVLVSDKKEKEI